MYCPNCGKEISDDSKFCNECGKPIEKKSSKDDKKTFDGFKHKGLPTIVLIVFLVSVFIIALVVSGDINLSGKENSIEAERQEILIKAVEAASSYGYKGSNARIVDDDGQGRYIVVLKVEKETKNYEVNTAVVLMCLPNRPGENGPNYSGGHYYYKMEGYNYGGHILTWKGLVSMYKTDSQYMWGRIV